MQAQDELENALRESAARYAQDVMDGKDNQGSEVELEPECCLCPFMAYSVLHSATVRHQPSSARRRRPGLSYRAASTLHDPSSHYSPQSKRVS